MKILVYITSKVHPAMWDNMLSLVDALSRENDVKVCDLHDNEVLSEVLSIFLESPDYFDMSIGFNSLGMEWNIEGVASKVHVYEELNFPHVSIMLDEPFNYCAAGYDTPCNNHIVTYLNRPDLQALDFMYPDKHMKKLFMPLGGTEKLTGDQAITAPKEYDVVVSAGNWIVDDGRPSWRSDDTPKGIVAILDDVADIMRSYPVSLMPAFEAVLQSRGMYDLAFLKSMEEYFWPVLKYIKPWRRQQMLKCLAESGIKVDLFGGGWEQIPFADSLIQHGAVSYSEMLDVISKTKVLVQDEALFNDGAHDRVFTAMLNGAVVVSEYSTYLEELFENQRDIFMFDWQNTREHLSVIPQLLNDEQYRLNIATSAYGKVAGKHTWRNRADRIIETIELFGGSNRAD